MDAYCLEEMEDSYCGSEAIAIIYRCKERYGQIQIMAICDQHINKDDIILKNLQKDNEVKTLLQMLADIPIDHMSDGSKTFIDCEDDHPVMVWHAGGKKITLMVGHVKSARRILLNTGPEKLQDV